MSKTFYLTYIDSWRYAPHRPVLDIADSLGLLDDITTYLEKNMEVLEVTPVPYYALRVVVEDNIRLAHFMALACISIKYKDRDIALLKLADESQYLEAKTESIRKLAFDWTASICLTLPGGAQRMVRLGELDDSAHASLLPRLYGIQMKDIRIVDVSIMGDVVEVHFVIRPGVNELGAMDTLIAAITKSEYAIYYRYIREGLQLGNKEVTMLELSFNPEH